jgi:hypothetical protein
MGLSLPRDAAGLMLRHANDRSSHFPASRLSLLGRNFEWFEIASSGSSSRTTRPRIPGQSATGAHLQQAPASRCASAARRKTGAQRAQSAGRHTQHHSLDAPRRSHHREQTLHSSNAASTSSTLRPPSCRARSEGSSVRLPWLRAANARQNRCVSTGVAETIAICGEPHHQRFACVDRDSQRRVPAGASGAAAQVSAWALSSCSTMGVGACVHESARAHPAARVVGFRR